jgi:glycogen(starch) synthase
MNPETRRHTRLTKRPMRIALISYEYPVDTPAGGIATYTRQAAMLLHRRGHAVEVFAGSPERDAVLEDDGVRVHLVREPSRHDFAVTAGHRFAARHAEAPFDVVEAPELYSESRKILELAPGVPLVLRMHTPNLRIWKLSSVPRGWREIAADLWGQLHSLPWYLKRGHRIPDLRLVSPGIAHAQQQDMIENACAAQADRVVALFPGMGEFLTDVWRIPPERVVVLPNPFSPSPQLLEIPTGTCPDTVSFIGRLEVRKGILDWMKAIPMIAKRHPRARFRFVGAGSRLADGTDTADMLRASLGGFADRLEFTGAVPPDDIPREFARTGVVVAPSRWENYPYACLEAMAAGRAVVGSSAGGMAVMLEDGAGVLVPPGKPGQLAAAVSDLLANPGRQAQLGGKARAKVLADHQPDEIGSRMERVYQEAIGHRRALGPRAR